MTAAPYDLQRRAVDSLCLKARALEEVHAIKLEMYGLLSYYDNLKTTWGSNSQSLLVIVTCKENVQHCFRQLFM